MKITKLTVGPKICNRSHPFANKRYVRLTINGCKWFRRTDNTLNVNAISLTYALVVLNSTYRGDGNQIRIYALEVTRPSIHIVSLKLVIVSAFSP